MANIKSAKKRAVQAEKRRARNRAVKSTLRTALKKARGIVAEGDAAKSPGVVSEASSAIDVAARKGVIHRNTASRLKSRLAKRAASA